LEHWELITTDEQKLWDLRCILEQLQYCLENAELALNHLAHKDMKGSESSFARIQGEITQMLNAARVITETNLPVPRPILVEVSPKAAHPC
jgi:hypothetical protein